MSGGRSCSAGGPLAGGSLQTSLHPRIQLSYRGLQTIDSAGVELLRPILFVTQVGYFRQQRASFLIQAAQPLARIISGWFPLGSACITRIHRGNRVIQRSAHALELRTHDLQALDWCLITLGALNLCRNATQKAGE